MRPCWFDLKQQMANQAKWRPPHPKQHEPCHLQIGLRVRASLQNTKQQAHLNLNADRWPTVANRIVCCFLAPPSCCCPCLPTRLHPMWWRPIVVEWPKLWLEAMLLWHTHPSFDKGLQCQLWNRATLLDTVERVSRDPLCSMPEQTSGGQIHCPSCPPDQVPSSMPSPRCQQQSKASWS